MTMADLNRETGEMLAKCLEAPRQNLLRDVMSYNDSMTISQVVKFFERQGVVFTKPMIQHYVRVGLLPPPEEKRRYTRFHLLLLAVVERLKGNYSLDDIAAVFSGFAPSEALIGPLQDLMEFSAAAWRETLDALVNKAAETAVEIGLEEQETRRAFESLVLLGLMTQSAAVKRTAGTLAGGGTE